MVHKKPTNSSRLHSIEKDYVDALIYNIRRKLSSDLLLPRYRKVSQGKKYAGYCYVATEALYYLLPLEIRINYRPAYVRVEGDTHWFLAGTKSGDIVDVTSTQYEQPVNYERRVMAAFMTTVPSRRAAELIRRVRDDMSVIPRLVGT